MCAAQSRLAAIPRSLIFIIGAPYPANLINPIILTALTSTAPPDVTYTTSAVIQNLSALIYRNEQINAQTLPVFLKNAHAFYLRF